MIIFTLGRTRGWWGEGFYPPLYDGGSMNLLVHPRVKSCNRFGENLACTIYIRKTILFMAKLHLKDVNSSFDVVIVSLKIILI